MSNHRRRAHALYATVCLALFAAISPASALNENGAAGASEEHLVIFHFNDLHGRIERLSRMATVVREARRQYRHVYFFCAGDNFSGNPVVDQADPRGEPVLKLLNTLGIQAMVLGNHEFDYGQEVLLGFVGRSRFPVLCANIEAHGPGWESVKPLVGIQSAAGPLLTVLGLIQIEPDSGIPSAHPSRLEGLKFQDPIETAVAFRSRLPRKGVRIALSHLGYATDRQLAEALPELDLILGGHSHTVLDSGVSHNGVLIAQAGAHGDYLGRIDVVLEAGEVTRSEARLIPMDSVQPAPDILSMVKAFESNPVMERVVATLPRTLEGKTVLGNWICDMLCRQLNLDIAFHNAGGVRVNRLEGAVRLQDIYQMLPFENLVVRMELYPREIRGLIATDISKHGKVDLLMSGIRLRVARTAAGKIHAIELMGPDGTPLNENRRYAVGFNSYIASSYRFDHDDPGKSLEMTTAASVIAYLESGRPPIPSDPALRAEEEIVAAPADTVDARCEDPLETGPDPFAGSSAAGNLMADAMREQSGAQVALFPSRLLVPGIRIAAGTSIGRPQLRSMFKHAEKNAIQVARLSGGQLRAFLLQQARFRKGMDLQVSGMSCTFCRNLAGVIDRVECRVADGSRLDQQTALKVAFCAYDYDRFYKLKPLAVEPRDSAVTLESALLRYQSRHPRLDSDLSSPRMILRDCADGE